MSNKSLILFIINVLYFAVPACGQRIGLLESGSGEVAISAELGDTLSIDVWADLARFTASGLSLYLHLPSDAFEVIDALGTREDGIQPFVGGDLFDDAVEIRNAVVSADEAMEISAAGQLLQYAALLGPGSNRSRTGSGLVASFKLRCAGLVAQSKLGIHNNPLHETLLVLADGRSERPFYADSHIEISIDPTTVVALGASWGIVKSGVGITGRGAGRFADRVPE